VLDTVREAVEVLLEVDVRVPLVLNVVVEVMRGVVELERVTAATVRVGRRPVLVELADREGERVGRREAEGVPDVVEVLEEVVVEEMVLDTMGVRDCVELAELDLLAAMDLEELVEAVEVLEEVVVAVEVRVTMFVAVPLLDFEKEGDAVLVFEEAWDLEPQGEAELLLDCTLEREPQGEAVGVLLLLLLADMVLESFKEPVV